MVHYLKSLQLKVNFISTCLMKSKIDLASWQCKDRFIKVRNLSKRCGMAMYQLVLGINGILFERIFRKVMLGNALQICTCSIT